MASQTSSTVNHDGNNVPSDAVYVPSSTPNSFPAGTGVINALGGTVVTDANNNTAAAQVLQLGDRTLPTQCAAVDPAGNLAVKLGSGSTPSIVQKASSVSTGSVTTLTATFTSNVTAGNTLVVSCGVGNNAAIAVTDTLGNTYTQASLVANSTTFEAAVFFAPVKLSGANTVTITVTSASAAMEIYEVSGILSQVPGQPSNASTGTGTGTTASTSNIGAAAPASLAFLAVSVGTAAQAVSVSTNTTWTLDSTQNSAGTPAGLFTFGALSQSVNNVSGVLPKATLAGSEPWAAASALFRTAAVPVEGTVSVGGYQKTNITSATTTLVKTGAGVLHSVTVNKMVASATVELDDAVTNTNSFGIITLPGTVTSMAPFTLIYDAPFSTGLSITTSQATDVTVVWK